MRSNRAGYNGSYKRSNNSFTKSASKGYSRAGHSSYNTGKSYHTSRTSGNIRYTRATMGSNAAREYGYYSSSYNSYNSSDLAHDFYYDTEIPVNTRNKRRVKRAEEKEIIQLNMPKTIASIAVVFALSLALLCAYAVNSSYRGEISSKQAELAEIQEENQYLKTTLEDNIDLSKIAREAEKIGLQKPQAYQITEVQVPNESYTVQYDAKISTQDKSVWDFIKSLLNK
ncbi:MAG: hypothetical protein Q4D26_02955 [Clostridia bacterium]|nr:hypothetical protein [Clostridia bacterium]